MSNEQDKLKHSSRLHKDQAAIDRQLEIAKAHGFPTDNPHKFAKRSATTCGDSNCVMCGNPRKFFGEPTIQELRQNQDVDTPRDRHSNGSTGTDDE
jgi:hypothetical protein